MRCRVKAADPGPRVGSRRAPLLALAVLLAGSVLRLAYLDADPDYYAWAGYITDEGRWVAHARELALFGRVVNTDWLLHLHLFLAPPPRGKRRPEQPHLRRYASAPCPR